MSVWWVIWLVAAAAAGLVWGACLVRLGSAMRRRCIVGSGTYDGPPHPAPSISVVVAAKDEEANIETCIDSLLRQDYPHYDVVVVDDRSTDRTPQILDRLERQAEGRLLVRTVSTLRDGWFGKNHAMREGVSASRGDWILFTDADCTFASPRAITIAMREALAHDVDFLSITPVLETRTVWERILQPVCALVLIVWFLPQRVNDRRKKTAYANGAFMLVRRSAYEQIGGHERVRAQLNEDIHLARFAKEAGLRLRVVENTDLYRTRMYRTPVEAWHGWSRIFHGCLGSLSRLLVSATLVTTLVIFPWVSLGAACVGWVLANPMRQGSWATAAEAWLAVVLLMQITIWRFYGILRIPSRWSLAYCVGAAATLGMLLTAMLQTLGVTRTTWRGTRYRKNRIEAQRDSPRGEALVDDGSVTKPVPHA